jgi:hypothetical protein
MTEVSRPPEYANTQLGICGSLTRKHAEAYTPAKLRKPAFWSPGAFPARGGKKREAECAVCKSVSGMNLGRRSNLLCPEIRQFFLGVLAAATKFSGFSDNHAPLVVELAAVKQWTIVNAPVAAMSGASTPRGMAIFGRSLHTLGEAGRRRRSVESAVAQAQP